MEMRLRLPELLDEKGVTAYELAKRSNGRILQATLYRLVKQRGEVRLIDANLLEAIMEILDVDFDEVLERRPAKRRAS